MELNKSFLFAFLAVGILASCGKERINIAVEEEPGVSDTELTYVENGLRIVASAVQTKVSVSIDDSVEPHQSVMAWEAGDHITVWHDGKTFDYVAASAGTSSVFNPVDAENTITAIDNTKPIVAYYNVSSVAAADGTGTFSISANQTEGAASNKVPLYAYTATPAPTEGALHLTFSPMASVLEFKISAGIETSDSFTYELTKVVLTPTTGITGWTVMTDGTINPATGVVTPASESTSAITLNFASSTDITTDKHFQMIIGNCHMDKTGATMDWYKGEIQNYTKSIWSSKDIDFTTYKHMYQPIAKKVVGINGYDGYFNKLYKNLNNQDTYINYCDDERNLILTGDVGMLGGDGSDPTKSRIPVINGLTWNLDGKNHKIMNFNVTDASSQGKYYLFYNQQADIRNVQFGATGGSARNSINISDTGVAGSLCVGVIGTLTSGTIENVTSYIEWTLTVNSTTGNRILGGIVGRIDGGTVKDCFNRGSLSLVTGTGVTSAGALAVGGIAGSSGGSFTITGSHNHAPVSLSADSSGDLRCAGIVGIVYSHKATITSCENHGTVSGVNTHGTDQTGTHKLSASGIVTSLGANQSSLVSSCTNSGAISGQSTAKVPVVQVAGMVCDFNAGNTISNCIQRANVSASGGTANYNHWYLTWVNGTVESGSVLKGVKVGGTTVGENNYNGWTWSRKGSVPDGCILTLLTE